MNIGPVKQSGNSGKPPAVVGLRMRMRMKMEMKMEMKIFEYWYEPWGRWVGLRWYVRVRPRPCRCDHQIRVLS